MFFTEKEVELANGYNLYYCRFVITREWYFLTCHNKTASTDRYKTFCHVYKMFWKAVRWRRLTFPPPPNWLDVFRHSTDSASTSQMTVTESYEICRLQSRFHIIRNHTRFADCYSVSTSYRWRLRNHTRFADCCIPLKMGAEKNRICCTINLHIIQVNRERQ